MLQPCCSRSSQARQAPSSLRPARRMSSGLNQKGNNATLISVSVRPGANAFTVAIRSKAFARGHFAAPGGKPHGVALVLSAVAVRHREHVKALACLWHRSIGIEFRTQKRRSRRAWPLPALIRIVSNSPVSPGSGAGDYAQRCWGKLGCRTQSRPSCSLGQLHIEFCMNSRCLDQHLY